MLYSHVYLCTQQPEKRHSNLSDTDTRKKPEAVEPKTARRSPVPTNNNKDKEVESEYAVAKETDDIYKVPTSNEPVELNSLDNLTKNLLYKVGVSRACNVYSLFILIGSLR